MASARVLQRHRWHGSFRSPALPSSSAHQLSNLTAARVSLSLVLFSQSYSLMASGVRAEVVEAFGINDMANDDYELNFGHRPCQVRRVLTQNLLLSRNPESEAK
jgi:hypothetical protein